MNASDKSATDLLLNPNRRSFLKTAAAGGAIAAAGMPRKRARSRQDHGVALQFALAFALGGDLPR
mgnify:CR=1 FL=1